MFIAWMRAIGGRIKSDLRFSNTFVYNSFPLTTLSSKQRRELVEAAETIAKVRSKYPDRSLSSLYEPDAMPKDLVAAHDQVDEVIDGLFGAVQDISEDDRQRLLFRMYGEMTGKKPSTAGARRR